MFVRPCFLVVDREFAGSISTRKLVIETAKFNVITAYSCAEAVATLERFPDVHGVVISADPAGEAETFLKLVRERHPEVKRVMTGEASNADNAADRCVESFSPDKLLQALRDLFPEPSAVLLGNEAKLQNKAGGA